MAEKPETQSALLPQPGSTLKRLTAPERELVDAFKRRQECNFDPTAAKRRRTVRAEVIERLVRCQRLPGKKSPLDIPPKGLNISGAIITGLLDLEECHFPARLGFLECNFEAGLVLRGARLGALILSGSSFNDLQGDGLEVGGDIFLRQVVSTGVISLLGAKIFGDVSLSGATLENVDENGAAIGDALCLQKLTIEGVFFFLGLKSPPLGHVDLSGMSATDVVDDGSLWPEPGKGDLFLDGFTYTRFINCPTAWEFRKQWLLRQAPRFLGEDFAPQPWVQCARVLREMGHERDARLLLYHMHETRRRGLKLGWRRAWGFLLRATTGHGYLPARSLAWIAGVVFFGWIVFVEADNANRMTPAKERFYLSKMAMDKYEATGELPDGYPKFQAFIYSVDVFLPIVSFSQEAHWRPANLATQGQADNRWWLPRTWNWYRIYNRLHIALGWFFTSIAVLAFSGLIKRD